MIKKLEKLQKDLAWWQDKLNRSRKESLRSIRAVHVQHLQDEIAKLTQQIRDRDLEMLDLKIARIDAQIANRSWKRREQSV
tara:strand:- start:61 stop:303 length:243 start_codon:yes stop_codon:yes gene_type:complete